MRKIISISSVSLLLFAPFAVPQATKTPVSPRGPSVAAGSQGVVVSGRPAATAAGITILEQGGNAADAGAATLLALSVTYVGAFCVGGEIPILVYSAGQNDQKNVKLLEGQGKPLATPKPSPGTWNTESRTVTSRQPPCLAPSMRSSPC